MFNPIIPLKGDEERHIGQQEESPDTIDIAKLYDDTAPHWSRDIPQVRDDLITWPLITSLARRYGEKRVVLDCGCGTGNICRLVSPFAKNVIGIDISAKMIAEAEKHTPVPSNILYMNGDMIRLTDYISPSSVNLCLSIFGFCCLHDLQVLKTAIKEMWAVLTEGGTAVVQVPHPSEGFFRIPSDWLQEVDSPKNYFQMGVPFRRKLRTADGQWLLVARHHFTLSNYVEAIVESGFTITQLLEPEPPASVLNTHPSLKRESLLPSSMILVLER